MKKIKVYVDSGYVGCKNENVIEVEDDATEEEIEELAGEAIYEMIDIGWYEVDDTDEAL